MLSEFVLFAFGMFIASSDNFHLSSLNYNNVREDFLFWDQHIADYYKPTKSTIYFGIGGVAVLRETLVANASVIYVSDNLAPAIFVPSSSIFSINFDFAINSSEYWSLGLENALVISSPNVDHPCFDDFRRAYHCASKVPFTDVSSYQTKREFTPTIEVSKTWLF